VDVLSFNRWISLVEHVALFSTAFPALQGKDGFLRWCDINHMSISAQKSTWMIMGQLKCTDELGEKRLNWLVSINMWESGSLARRQRAQHYHEKASKACKVACGSFALNSFIGTFPSKVKWMYMAMVDPMLTFCPGCGRVAGPKFNRRTASFLTVPCSMQATLFTETGIINRSLPLRFRFAKLAIGYLINFLALLRLPHAALPLCLFRVQNTTVRGISLLAWTFELGHWPSTRSKLSECTYRKPVSRRLDVEFTGKSRAHLRSVPPEFC
jgi:hypothetical protein